MPMSRRPRSDWLGSSTSPPLITRSNLSSGPMAASAGPPAAVSAREAAPVRTRRRDANMGCLSSVPTKSILVDLRPRRTALTWFVSPAMSKVLNHVGDGLGDRCCMVLVAEKRKMIGSRHDQKAAIGRNGKPVALQVFVPVGAFCGGVWVLVDPAIGRNDGHRHGAYSA